MSAPRTAWRNIACLLALTSGTTQAESALDGATLFKLACQACHAVGPDTSRRIGPRLDGIAGRPTGTATDYPYSEALKRSGLVWNRSTLIAWIAGAERIVPGTLMVHHNHLEAPEVLRLADYLTEPEREP